MNSALRIAAFTIIVFASSQARAQPPRQFRQFVCSTTTCPLSREKLARLFAKTTNTRLHPDNKDVKRFMDNISGSTRFSTGDGTSWTLLVSDELSIFVCLPRNDEGFTREAAVFDIQDFLTKDTLCSLLSTRDSCDLSKLLKRVREIDIEAAASILPAPHQPPRIFICGSASLKRKKPKPDGNNVKRLLTRPRPASGKGLPHSDYCFVFSPAVSKGRLRLKITGLFNLRRILLSQKTLSAFETLAAKENGINIEAITLLPPPVSQDGFRLLLGLRCPVLRQHAVVVELEVDRDGGVLSSNFTATGHSPCKDNTGHPGETDGSALSDSTLRFLFFNGRGIRAMTRFNDRILLIAASAFPVTSQRALRSARHIPLKARPHTGNDSVDSELFLWDGHSSSFSSDKPGSPLEYLGTFPSTVGHPESIYCSSKDPLHFTVICDGSTEAFELKHVD